MHQEAQLTQWLGKVQRLVVIEIGAGIDIPTVLHFSQGAGAPLIRINSTAPERGQVRGISLRMGGRAALQGIADAL